MKDSESLERRLGGILRDETNATSYLPDITSSEANWVYELVRLAGELRHATPERNAYCGVALLAHAINNGKDP